MPKQPLSSRDYAVIGLIALLFGIGLLVLFVLLAPKLIPAGILDQFFYILLLSWGLVCAIVLFGVMKTYARLTYKRLGIVLELGGPVVAAFLVVLGGFELIPRQDTFDLTVRPRSTDAPLITSGKVRIEFGNLARTEAIDSNGEANFKGVPRKFWGDEVSLLPEIEGYKQVPQKISLASAAVAIDVDKDNPETTLRGQVDPPPRLGQVVKVLVEGESGEVTPDQFGRFRTIVHRKVGDRIRIQVYVDSQQVYDEYQLVPGPNESITLVEARPTGRLHSGGIVKRASR
jgi:hypothetical protein